MTPCFHGLPVNLDQRQQQKKKKSSTFPLALSPSWPRNSFEKPPRKTTNSNNLSFFRKTVTSDSYCEGIEEMIPTGVNFCFTRRVPAPTKHVQTKVSIC